MKMDSNNDNISSQPLSVNAASVIHIAQHLWHAAILVMTLAIASVSPRCCAVTAIIIAIIAIPTIPMQLLMTKVFQTQSSWSKSDNRLKPLC